MQNNQSQLIAVVVLLALSLTAAPAAADFPGLVKRIEAMPSLQRQSIPFLGLGRFVVNLTRPDGVEDLRLAIFRRTSTAELDLRTVIDQEVQSDWKPFIKSRSRSGEEVHMFARDAGDSVRLLLISAEKDEVVLVETQISPERFAQNVLAPKSSSVTANLDF